MQNPKTPKAQKLRDWDCRGVAVSRCRGVGEGGFQFADSSQCIFGGCGVRRITVWEALRIGCEIEPICDLLEPHVWVTELNLGATAARRAPRSSFPDYGPKVVVAETWTWNVTRCSMNAPDGSGESKTTLKAVAVMGAARRNFPPAGTRVGKANQ